MANKFEWSRELEDALRKANLPEEQISALGPYCPRELLACKDDMFAASRSTDISLQNTLAGLAVLCDKL